MAAARGTTLRNKPQVPRLRADNFKPGFFDVTLGRRKNARTYNV